ncbi:MAG: hypothetical protein HY755_01020 [Nitrospirae bacterium]|nr:hypothetical protein [Nitrospirota bacterium]
MSRDITNFGWIIVSLVLVGSGIRHIIVQEIHGRIIMAGKPPIWEGWPVIMIGVTEVAAGILLLYIMIRKT